MTPAALNFESYIRQLIRQGDLDGALGYVRFIVDHIRHDPASVGQTLTSPTLDRLCGEIGALSLAQLRSASEFTTLSAQPADVIILATELYALGGHTRLIEDMIAAQPGKRHLVLLTDFLGSGAAYRPALDAEVKIAQGEQRIDKLLWLQHELAQHPQAQVLVFNHHGDAAAIAAIQRGLNREVIFCHHADHHLCLGAHLGDRIHDARHVDFFAHHHRHCCEHGIPAAYWPISVPDRGSRSHAPDSFLRRGQLVTCTSGVWTKFNPLYPFHYWEELPGMLHASGGTHIHIGDIPPELLAAMRDHLAANGVKPDRLIHIPKVTSVWDTLLERKVDLYIGSFPLGGGRALIEALGAGIPAVVHRHPLLDTNGLGPADTATWSTPEELRSILKGATRENLAARSQSARVHYLQFHNPQVFKACVSERHVVPTPSFVPVAADAVSAYLLRAACRHEELDAVFQQLQQRIAGNADVLNDDGIVASAQVTLDEAIALFTAGKLEAAYTAFSQIVERSPASPVVLIHLGLIAISAGLDEDADVFFGLAIECAPDRASTEASIGQQCMNAYAPAFAERYLAQALESNPRLTGAYALLTDVWQMQGRTDDALAALQSRMQQSAAVEPEILSRLVTLARNTGNIDVEYAACLQARQYPELHCRAISLMSRRNDISRNQLSTEARRFASAHVKTRATTLPFVAHRPLRVGFVMGRLDNDDTGARLESLLCHLDPAAFETILFFDEIVDSPLVQRALLVVDSCHAISRMDADAATSIIRKQNIDVLVNLQLHDHVATLLLFAQRLAPMQLNWSVPARTSALANVDCVVCAEKDYTANDFTEKCLAVNVDDTCGPAFASAFGEAIVSLWQQRAGTPAKQS
ncbi:MAG TPA: hypothetical protein VFW00_10240 [Rhodocyclaceae bacterium]|nr:hypothetical protein [Rhodocyclaceae bacterium]